MIPMSEEHAASITFRLNRMSEFAEAILSFLAPVSHGKPHGCVLDRRGKGPLIARLNNERDHEEHGGDKKTKSTKLS